MSSENPYQSPRGFEQPTPSDAERPTTARLVVLAFLCTLALVLYLDRVCMGQAVKPIQEEMKLSDTEMSYVLMAFTLAYGLFEMPVGHWSDRIGSKRVLARIVLTWSAFTALTGVCTGLVSLIFVRFLFGAGEAGAYPNAAKVIGRWFPVAERGRVQGLFMASSLIGGTIAPTATGYMISSFGWRWTFGVFGALGVVWVAVFLRWFRDDPADHPSVGAKELRHIRGGEEQPTATHASEPFPWASLRNLDVWRLGFIITCGSFVAYLYFSWYPKYLQEARGLKMEQAGWCSSAVLGGGALGMFFGGLMNDLATRRSWPATWFRRCMGFGAYTTAAALLLVAMHCEDMRIVTALTSVSCLTMLSQQPAWWTAVTEVGGRNVGALFGLINGLGVFGAMSSQLFFGVFSDWRKSAGFTGRAQFDPAFYVYAGVLVLGAICWLTVNSTYLADKTTSKPDVK